MSLAIGEITSPVEGVGTVKFYFDSDNGRNNITLHNVMYSPKLRNLMSGPALDKNGGTLLWEEREKLRFSIGMDENFYARKINGSSQNESIRGIPKLKSINVECEDCEIGKTSHDGNNYFLSITDDYSRKVTVFPIKRKSDVFNCFTRYQKRAERFLNNKVVNIGIDNGLEFIQRIL
ncbi:retrovirus-related Pol polyprotein from transposon TNT 1-94 [Trichonephila clavipes]|nr:retrovirus-related Pol polyprotein from transposon TNT 1-94 [Trichonephila clavipes]